MLEGTCSLESAQSWLADIIILPFRMNHVFFNFILFLFYQTACSLESSWFLVARGDPVHKGQERDGHRHISSSFRTVQANRVQQFKWLYDFIHALLMSLEMFIKWAGKCCCCSKLFLSLPPVPLRDGTEWEYCEICH